jgi:outer membrane lipoprotein carrier protein
LRAPTRKAAWIATAALWACAAGAAASLAADAQALLAELRSAYDTTTDLTARFVQTSHLAAAGMDQESHGTVVFQKGGKMRWAYEGDDPQVIVSDGKTLWIYQVRDKTVLRQKLTDVPASNRLALDLLSGFSGVEKAFSVGSCGPLCLELTPREPRADLTRVRVELEPDRTGVRQVTTEDSLGNWTRLEFRDIRRNAGVPKDAFVFEPPEGTQVVDVAGAEK